MSPRLPIRRRLGELASLLLVVSALAVAVPAAATAAAPDDPQSGKIKPQLAHQLESKGAATFWIRFTDRPDLSRAATIEDRTVRGQYVYDRLTKAARDSQSDVVALLDDRGATYRTFWAANAIRVQAGSQALADELTAQPEVQALYPTFTYKLEEPRKGSNVHRPDAVEWGVANINADDVWSEFGDTGEDIVVASIDSGVQYDHPALVGQYRGNNGDGTFTHDYNWFDASGTCGGAPCDNDGHGTHTMGTMVGDDGAANQVGVAPGAKWITANGCCPSDEALIASGEWMLAPTDLEGENPDVSKRPDIINSSWGTELPSNDPFMEDVEEAWAASGIFGSWSNGNNGPSCETSGSPGSRIINYSVGAYDVNNAIAGFSSRGAGQDGEIKPNISAPGVNVRSSVPGNSYASFSGTSMAAPHLAGTIALLWSAAPSLRGDIEGTRAILDGTAVDVDNTTCGGTTDDNNVFGEGRLDALALLQSAPVGETGTLAGTVTDEETGDPIGGATVAVDGELDRSTTTDEDGGYSLRLPTGDYAVSASAFGYGTEDGTATITADTVTTQDFALSATPSVTVRGTVTDGGGHGWPLYARITIAGPAPDVWTDPTTGDYSVDLPSGATYSMTVTADLPGYLPSTSDVAVGGADVTHDVALQVDDSTCTAPGYVFNTAGVTEDFDGEALPDGWTVTDELDNGQVWTFDDPGGQGNLTGGEGGFAIVDSDNYGSGGEQDTSLVSPVVDMSDLTAPVVGFAQDYNNLGDSADVDVSIDGGATWETVLHQTTDVRGPRTDVLQLPTAAGQSEVQVRFHYYDASYAWWWQVDDVFIGNRTCDPVEGGLVVGNVRGSTGRTGINGATVTSIDKPEDKATTKPTPDDPAVDDGFYQLFSSLTGRHPFEASANKYQSQTRTVNVPRNRTAAANFRLDAGQVTVDPTSISVTKRLGTGTVTRPLTLTNTGTAPVTAELSTGGGGFVMQGGAAGTASTLRQMDNAPQAAAEAQRSGQGGSALGGSTPGRSKNGPQLGGSGLQPGRSVTPALPKRANDEVTLTQSVSQEIVTGTSVACSNSATGETRDTGWLRVFSLEDFDITSDFGVTSVSFGVETVRGGDVPMNVNLYTLDGALEYANMTPIGSTQETLSPQELTLVTVPVEGTVPAGGRLVVEIDAPDQAGTGRAFFVGANDAGQTAPTYLRSATCGTPEPVDVAELGFPDFNMVLNVTGETGGSVPWLTVEPTTVTLDPGESARVTATLDSAVEQPGTYTARINISTDAPGEVAPVAVTMTITPPPTWGKVQGTVRGADCSGAAAPLDEATVQLDWWSGYVTLFTDEDGRYARWLDRRGNPYSAIVAKDGYRPTTRTVKVVAGSTVTSDYTLTKARC